MRVLAGALVALLSLPLAARAQAPAPRVPKSEAIVREAERDAADFEQWVRAEWLLREEARRAVERPDLSYDVRSGIQQRNLQRALGR